MDIDDIFKDIEKSKNTKNKLTNDTPTSRNQNDYCKQPTGIKKDLYLNQQTSIEDSKYINNPTDRKYIDGLPIYTLEELKIGQGGDTEDCPFECDCCY